MSEENIENAESETLEISPAENFVNVVTAKDFVSASKEFEEMMTDKVSNALEQEKINIADQIFNGGNPDDTEENEEDFDDDSEETDEAEQESEEDWDEEETNKRMDVIGQNGNDGLHYDDIESDDAEEDDAEEEK